MRAAFRATVITLSFALGWVSLPASASHVSVDFGPVFGPGGDGDDFGTNTVGNGTACTPTSSAPESCPLTLLSDASTGAIPLGFAIDFGSGPVSNVYVNENGIVSFGAAITAPSFNSLAGNGQPVIAPFLADLTSVTFTGTVFEMSGQNFGQIMYQRGSASALPGPDGNFAQSDEVPAFAVLWYGLKDSTGNPVFAQLIVYSHAASAAGDFDIRFRYGLADTDQYNAGTGVTGIAGLSLGANSLTISGSLSATSDYFYSFRGGKLVGATPPPPPLTLTCPTGTAQVGTTYTSALAAAGGVAPYTYSTAGTLPAGLTLDPSTGALTGTPTAAGTFAFTAQVTDTSGLAAGSVTASCSIAVAPSALRLTVAPSSVSFGTVPRYSIDTRKVTLTNTGTAAIALSKLSVVPAPGASHSDFAALGICGRSLAPGRSCPVYVALFAGHLGVESATLLIPNNAVGSPQSVPLSATVIPPTH